MDPLYRKMRRWGREEKGKLDEGTEDRWRVDENMYRGTNDLGQRSMKVFWPLDREDGSVSGVLRCT